MKGLFFLVLIAFTHNVLACSPGMPSYFKFGYEYEGSNLDEEVTECCLAVLPVKELSIDVFRGNGGTCHNGVIEIKIE